MPLIALPPPIIHSRYLYSVATHNMEFSHIAAHIVPTHVVSPSHVHQNILPNLAFSFLCRFMNGLEMVWEAALIRTIHALLEQVEFAVNWTPTCVRRSTRSCVPGTCSMPFFNNFALFHDCILRQDGKQMFLFFKLFSNFLSRWSSSPFATFLLQIGLFFNFAFNCFLNSSANLYEFLNWQLNINCNFFRRKWFVGCLRFN